MLNRNGMVSASCTPSKSNTFLRQLYPWIMVGLAIVAVASNLGLIL